jgi:ABC-type transport system involved in cytochrome c biogenesis permease subunit
MNKKDTTNVVKNINNHSKSRLLLNLPVFVLMSIGVTLLAFIIPMREISEFWYIATFPVLFVSLALLIFLLHLEKRYPSLEEQKKLSRKKQHIRMAVIVIMIYTSKILTTGGYPIAAYIAASITAIFVSICIYKYWRSNTRT